jgi:uncharacterized protein YndB with AHSA1/START domain
MDMTEAVTQIRAPIERIAPDTIRLERMLDAPPEKVWRYLTEAELRAEWFMGGTDARPDGEFELVADHDRLSADDVPCPAAYAEFQGRVWNEKVLRFEPPRLLETTFAGGKQGVVTYELYGEGDRTHRAGFNFNRTNSRRTDQSGSARHFFLDRAAVLRTLHGIARRQVREIER